MFSLAVLVWTSKESVEACVRRAEANGRLHQQTQHSGLPCLVTPICQGSYSENGRSNQFGIPAGFAVDRDSPAMIRGGKGVRL